MSTWPRYVHTAILGKGQSSLVLGLARYICIRQRSGEVPTSRLAPSKKRPPRPVLYSGQARSWRCRLKKVGLCNRELPLSHEPASDNLDQSIWDEAHECMKQKVCSAMSQGCQMVCFQTKNPNLGKFERVL
jgi:hypothetical protein